MRAVVLVPVYDNAATVGEVVRACRAVAGDVLVVSDGSTDGSDAAAEAAGAEVVRLPSNQGKGAALLAGMARAAERGYTHAVTVDADGQHPPSEIPRLVEAARGDEARLWVGVRRMEEGRAPASSRRGRAISNFWATLDGWRRCRDVQSGFRVYPIAATLRLPCRQRRFAFEMEVLVRAAWAGVPIGHVDVDVIYPAAAERVSHFRQGRDNLRFTWLSFVLFWGMVARAPLLAWRRLRG